MLGVRKTKDIEQDLIWCFSEIQKDIMALAARDSGVPKEIVPNGIGAQGLEGEHIEAALRDLKWHADLWQLFSVSPRGPFKWLAKTN